MGRPFEFKEVPSQERLKLLLDYDPETGILRWKKAEEAPGRWNPHSGKEVKSLNGGYIRVFLDGEHHYAQRVIWKMHYGYDPVQVDHINGIKNDNRIANLRDVSREVNSKNRKLYAANKSGVNGVSFHERDKVWSARVSVGKSKDVHLGSFETKAEAVAARIAADIILQYHENHGKPRNQSS